MVDDNGEGFDLCIQAETENRFKQKPQPQPQTHWSNDMSNQIDSIASIEIDVVIAGTLQRITFTAGTDPVGVPELLRRLDPNVQFRDSFPTRGGAPRATLQARVLVINIEGRADSTFIKLVCKNSDGEDLSVSIPKRKTSEFLPSLEGLGKLSERNTGKLRVAMETKKGATVILTEAEQIGIAYWKTEGGDCYMESMTAEPPATGAPA